MGGLNFVYQIMFNIAFKKLNKIDEKHDRVA